MADVLDPRRFVCRADLAAAALKGQVEAERYASPDAMQVQAPVLDLYSAPNRSVLASQVIKGEQFDVYEVKDGWAWGQNKADGYVGYVRSEGLGPVASGGMTITAMLAHIYPEPSFKAVPTGQLSFLSKIEVKGEQGDFLETPDGFVSKAHVGELPTTLVAVCGKFLGLPYLWGGRSAYGLDCSALVQMGLWAIGLPCPRDSDMQQADLGAELAPGSAYHSGDLVFWKGHVGIMQDESTLLHANVHAMAVSLEPIEDAIARIAKTDGPVVAHKRLTDGGA